MTKALEKNRTLEKAMEKGTAEAKVYLKPLLTGMIAGCAVLILTLALCAFAIASVGAPVSVIPVGVITASVAGGFVGGYGAAKAMGKQGMLLGAAAGMMLSLLELTAGFIWFHTPPSITGFTRAALFLISAMIGGVLGVNGRRGKSRRHR